MGNLPTTRFVRSLAMVAAAILLAFLGGRYIQTIPQAPPRKPEIPDLALDAIGLNKTLPEIVSEGVRLDRTGAGPGKVFNYFYTILDDDQARIISNDASRLQQIASQLNERVCVMMPNYVKNGVVVKYHLRNRSGADLPSIIVDPDGCKSASNNN